MPFMNKRKKPQRGILVDYEWCTGCHSCEMACQMEKGLPIGQAGVKVFQIGPWKVGEDKWQYDYSPVFGELCNLCPERVSKGKLPTCVKHCQAKCLEYGPLDELSKRLSDHPKQSLYAL